MTLMHIFSLLSVIFIVSIVFFFILFFSTHFSCFLDLNISLFPHPSPPFSTHSSSVTSPIQSGDERCTTSSPACQLRTSIAPWAEGKTDYFICWNTFKKHLQRKRRLPAGDKKTNRKKPREDNHLNTRQQQRAFRNFTWFLDHSPYFEEKLPP